MKYKIQQNNPFFGYVDMKYTTDGGKTYKCDFFDTYKNAQIELVKTLIEVNDLGGIENYRIVEENVEADYDLNAENHEKGQKMLEMMLSKFKN